MMVIAIAAALGLTCAPRNEEAVLMGVACLIRCGSGWYACSSAGKKKVKTLRSRNQLC